MEKFNEDVISLKIGKSDGNNAKNNSRFEENGEVRGRSNENIRKIKYLSLVEGQRNIKFPNLRMLDVINPQALF